MIAKRVGFRAIAEDLTKPHRKKFQVKLVSIPGNLRCVALRCAMLTGRKHQNHSMAETIFVDVGEKVDLPAMQEVFLHTRLFLVALIKGRYRSRLLRLWTLFVLIAPLLAPVLLRIMKDAGALVTENIRLENTTYTPINISSMSQPVIDSWRADASLLGFGPSDNPVAMNLSRSVCERLGVDFANTRRFLNDKEAENARLLEMDGLVMFLEGGKLESFKIYHTSFERTNLDFAQAYKDSLNGHQLYIGEVAATSGIIDLQGAANQAVQEMLGAPVSAELLDLSIVRSPDPLIEYPNYAASISYVLFLYFAASAVMSNVSSGMSSMIRSGVQLTMELKGMNPKAFLLGWFMMGCIVSTIGSIVLTAFCYILEVFSTTPPALVLFSFIFHGWALCAFCVLYVRIVGRKLGPIMVNAVLFIISLAFLVSIFLVLLLMVNIGFEPRSSEAEIYATFLIPPNALGYLLFTIAISEIGNLPFDSVAPYANVALGFLAFDVVLYLVLFFAVDELSRLFCGIGLRRKITGASNSERGKGIYVENLVKNFRVNKEYEVEKTSCFKKKTVTKKKKVTLSAVDGMNMQIETDQVFCLLGQNGAGKSTMFKLLSGEYTPTSGKVEFVGDDIRIGLCPQFDTLLDTITCIDQLTMVAQFSGLGKEQAEAEAKKMLAHLGIDQKANDVPSVLSGGQRRRLSVALATIGTSTMLFMDEPTTGLDPLNRRRIWELLRQLRRQGRTIVLTTHSMEEAEALGDTIAIMNKGKLQANGTSVELRKHYGPWYHLACIRTAADGSSKYDPSELLKFIQSSVPNAEVLANQGSMISFNLPIESIKNFPDLLDGLDTEKDSFGISSFRVSPSTLDDVFMRLAASAREEDEQKEKGDVETGLSPSGSVRFVSQEKGAVDAENFDFVLKPDRPRQVKTMLRYIAINMIRTGDLIIILFFNVILFNSLAAAIQVAFIQDTSDDPSVLDPSELALNYGAIFPLNQSEAEAFLNPRAAVFVNSQDPAGSLGIFNGLKIVSFFEQINEAAAEISSTIRYNQYTATANGLESAVQLIYAQTTKNITQPVATLQPWRDVAQTNDQFATNSLHLAAIGVGSLSIGPAADILASKYSRVREALLLAGLSKPMYWLSYIVVHHLAVLLGLVIGYIILYAAGLAAVTESSPLVYVIYWIVATPCLVFYGYFWSTFYNYKQRGDAVGFWICTLMLFPWAIVSFAFSEPNLPFENAMTVLFPGYGAFRLYAYFQVAAYNDVPPTLEESFEWDFGYSQVLLYTFISTVLFGTYMYIHEFIGFKRLIRLCCSLGQNKIQSEISFESLKAVDEQNVQDVMAGILPKPVTAYPADVNKANCEVWTENAGKVFNGIHAVSNASLGTQKGEIFGLLGPNGAGKTTLIKSISGIDGYRLDEGVAWVHGINTQTSLGKARAQMGVCPQFDTLNPVFSPRELFTLFSRLRGIPEEKIEALVQLFIKDLELEEKADSWTKNLSGGQKRKTSIGLSMVGNPPAVFLDEPSTGIDPATKHAIWDFLLQSSNPAGRSVLLTTHSMEEADALCSRLSIMVQSSIRTSGKPEELKLKYGGGLVAVLTVDSSAVEDTFEYAQGLIAQISSTNDCLYRDSRNKSDMFKFSFPNGTAWSKMFEVLNEAENLQDFSLSQKSLEDVFVQLAELQESTESKA